MTSVLPPPGAVTTGYDGSVAADRALEWAAATAAHQARPLHILGVRDTADADDITGPAVARARQQYPDLEVSASAPVGSPRYVLVEAAANASTMVLGNRGRSRWRAALLGTVSLSVAMHATCPVVIVRAGHEGVTPPQRLLVGVDGSPTSLDAARRAISLAPEGATVRIVMAWPIATTPEQIPAAAHEILSDLPLVERPEVTVVREALPGHPVDVLTSLSAETDLVVLGRRGAEGYTGLQMGSTAQHVLNEISCPVAIVPQAD